MNDHPQPHDINTSTIVTITEWNDDLVEAHGYPVRSDYTERFWLPVLGPTASWILRRLALELEASNTDVYIDLGTFASDMGLSYRTGTNSPFAKGLQRLTMFGIAHQTANGFAVRTTVPIVAHRHTKRWSTHLQYEHNSVLAADIKAAND